MFGKNIFFYIHGQSALVSFHPSPATKLTYDQLIKLQFINDYLFTYKEFLDVCIYELILETDLRKVQTSKKEIYLKSPHKALCFQGLTNLFIIIYL